MAFIRTNTVCHMAIIVEDIDRTVSNWAKLFNKEKPEIIHIPSSDKVPAYTDGKLGDYSDCKISVIHFENLALEFVEPGPGPSPWRDLLEKQGGNCLQNISFVVPEGKEAFAALKEVGVPAPFHIGYYPGGTYTFIESSEQLGIPINIKFDHDNKEITEYLLKHPDKVLTEKEITEEIEVSD